MGSVCVSIFFGGGGRRYWLLLWWDASSMSLMVKFAELCYGSRHYNSARVKNFVYGALM